MRSAWHHISYLEPLVILACEFFALLLGGAVQSPLRYHFRQSQPGKVGAPGATSSESSSRLTPAPCPGTRGVFSRAAVNKTLQDKPARIRYPLPDLASRAAADCQTPSQMFPAAVRCLRPSASAPLAPDGASLRWRGRMGGWQVLLREMPRSFPWLRIPGTPVFQGFLCSSPYRGALLKNLAMNVSSRINSYSLLPMRLFSTCNARCGAGLWTLTSQPGGEDLHLSLNLREHRIPAVGVEASKRDLGSRRYWQT